MSDLKIAVAGQVYQGELTTTQIAILASVNAWTFTIPTAGVPIATITTATPHALTFTPTAGTLPNFFVTFQGNITAQTGTGTIIGPIFRILSIPSTTTFQIATSVLTATAATTAAIVPVFIPEFLAQTTSAFGGGPTVGTPPVTVAGALQSTANVNITTGVNCVVNYYPDNTGQIFDSTNLPTPAVAPVARVLLPASSQGQVWMDAVGSVALVASGAAGTSRVSVIE